MIVISEIQREEDGSFKRILRAVKLFIIKQGIKRRGAAVLVIVEVPK
jgi:hypothetical protein